MGVGMHVQTPMNGLQSAWRRLVQFENRFVENFLVEHSTTIAFATYAFVFGYYGFLKVQALATGMATPVRGEVGHLVQALGLPSLGISLTAAMAFIGIYEVTLGVLFAFKRIRLVLPLFLVHMAGTFATLVIARGAYFQDPTLAGVPWLFDTFAAYILKNTIFVGGFLVLASVELSRRRTEPATGGPAADSVQAAD
jgi:hypothetical protein